MRAAIVYNPKAGANRTERQVEWAAEVLRDYGWEVAVKPTRQPGQMHELAAVTVAEGIDAIFAAGGDGTVGAVADGVAGSPVVLGLLPVGTANLWAAELKLAGGMNSAITVRQCIEAQLNGTVRAVDMGSVTVEGRERKFLLWAGLGLDAHVVSQIEPRPEMARRLGAFYYSIFTLWAAVSHRGAPVQIRTERGALTGTMIQIVIANARLYAGNDSILDPEARADDGLLEVWGIYGEGFVDTLARLGRFKLGRHLGRPGMRKVRGQKVEIETRRPMLLQCDGELLGRVTQVAAQVCPGVLRVFTPRRDDLEIFERRV